MIEKLIMMAFGGGAAIIWQYAKEYHDERKQIDKQNLSDHEELYIQTANILKLLTKDTNV